MLHLSGQGALDAMSAEKERGPVSAVSGQATMPAGPVFLSYASEDVAAAERIAKALRTAGIEVWFDQSALRGGDVWDQTIRKQIKTCSLFIPVISRNTHDRDEGYFRFEWKLAVDRSHLMTASKAFLLPVVIDTTSDDEENVPDRFRDVQWTRLPGGNTPPEFVERVVSLLSLGRTGASITAELPAGSPPTGTSPLRKGIGAWWHRKRALLVIAAMLAVGVLAYFVFHTAWLGKPWVPPLAPRIAATPAASKPNGVTVTSAANDRKCIAVLPFENLSGRAEDAYLADGLQAEVLNRLARLRELTVISRTSTLEYRGKAYNVREIGHRLGVGTILEGSVQRAGSKLRLSVQLIDANNDRNLLAANYDRELGHLLDLQSAVASRVADSLVATLSLSQRGELERVGTNSGDAYALFLRAIALLNSPDGNGVKDLQESKRLLQAAVKRDPGYPDAYAWLSMVNTMSFQASPGDDSQDRNAARRAFERAFEIDPELPEARMARGMYATFVTLDPSQAVTDLQAVVESRPSSAWAHLELGLTLRRLGRMDDALAHLVRAWDLDPLNKANSYQPLITLLGLRRWPEAIRQTEIQLLRFPDNPWHYMFRAHIESLAQRDVEPLRVALREHGNEVDQHARAVIEFEVAIAEKRYLDAVRLQDIGWSDENAAYRETFDGILYHAADDESRARESFLAAEAHQLRGSEGLAIVQSMLGKHAAALATIDEARARQPESRDAINGPELSFVRSVILVRAGRREEGYAEVNRLLHVPFGAPSWKFGYMNCVQLLVKDDPHYDELLHRPPRL